jgi:hypothetical protein
MDTIAQDVDLKIGKDDELYACADLYESNDSVEII